MGNIFSEGIFGFFIAAIPGIIVAILSHQLDVRHEMRVQQMAAKNSQALLRMELAGNISALRMTGRIRFSTVLGCTTCIASGRASAGSGIGSRCGSCTTIVLPPCRDIEHTYHYCSILKKERSSVKKNGL